MLTGKIHGVAKTYAQQFASKGGKARAAKLSKARRVEIAKLASRARWGKRKASRLSTP